MTRLYVYALTGTPVAPFSDGGQTVESLEIDGVYVVAIRAHEKAATTEKALRRQHALVERLVEAADAVLPAKFGSLVDDEELRCVIGARRGSIAEALGLVMGRRQMTVRFIQRGGVAEPQAALPDATGTAYLHRRRGAARGTVPAADLAAFQEAVRDLIAGERVTAGTGDVLSTVFHLVDRMRIEEYRSRATAAGEHLAGTSILVTGPWPAFAFVPELLP